MTIVQLAHLPHLLLVLPCRFFLELLLKSMTEHLASTGRLGLDRRLRFDDRFLSDIAALCSMLTNESISRAQKSIDQASSINSSLAFFVRDSYSLLDRSFVTSLVRAYNLQVSAKIVCLLEIAAILMRLKCDFLRIVCSHEHFVILNLPFLEHLPLPSCSSPGSSLSGDSRGSIGIAELTVEFRTGHFLVGLVLADLDAVLGTSNRDLHAKVVTTIRNLLEVHDSDGRVNEGDLKSKVASLYLPLIGIVLDSRCRLFDPYSSITTNDIATSQREPGLHPKIALAIAGVAVSSPETPRFSTLPKTADLLAPETTRQLLACFCWTLENLDRRMLARWMGELSGNKLGQFLDVLQLCASCFEFRPNYEKAEDARNPKSEKNESVPLADVHWRRENATTTSGYCSSSPKEELGIASNLATEIALIIVDTLEMLLISVNPDQLSCILSAIVRVELHMLACDQSSRTVESLLDSLRSLIVRHPDLLFVQQPEQCGQLCLQLLRHCSSDRLSVKTQAAVTLYILMRRSFQSGAHFVKVKVRITLALSTLVSVGGLDGHHLRTSLKTVLSCSETDVLADFELSKTNFAGQVKDLVFNLYMILSETVRMKDFADDFEMLMDLMYRVAKGYRTNPDLRLTWLLNMANKHADRSNFAEAAQCLVHSAALAAEYVSMTDHPPRYLPRGANSFSSLGDDVLEESAVSDDVISPAHDGVCESGYFEEEGLVLLIDQAAQFFQQAQMYEAMMNAYKIATPIVEKWRDYRRLARIHCRLSEALVRIDPPNINSNSNSSNISTSINEDSTSCWRWTPDSTDRRCFGTYFRVAFYGCRFGDLDGRQFIYKEPVITKLAEISARLEQFYSDRFGKGVLELIKDSNPVDPTKLDQTKSYLQITYVEPYFQRWELRKRRTHFERNVNLKRFVFATPFTKDGRAHGDLKDQLKRRTVLTTEHSFPYLTTRLPVVRREQTVLGPIEVAIEDVQKKTRELAAATLQQPADAKMLQMVLQGCIGTTVNQGPLEDFSKKCADALQKNRTLIQADQQAYQNELQRNYIEFTRKMAPIVGTAAGICKKKKKSKSPLEGDISTTIATV